MSVSSPRAKHWTRAEYERLVDLGAFRPGERLELVGGALLVREPQGGPHATAVGLVEDALRAVFGAGWTVRGQFPIALDDDSEPEPDVAVVPGSRRDYVSGHPSRPVLIVEVADTTLAYDRRTKLPLYAKAGIVEVWIVDVNSETIESFRSPSEAGYAQRMSYGRDSSIRPAQLPTASIRIDDIFK